MLTYSFENTQGKSKYEHLYLSIRADIASGALKAGEKLPSKRALAEHLGISTVTVENAYGQLVSEGYIYTRPRSGFYVSEIYSGQPAPNRPEREHTLSETDTDEREADNAARDIQHFPVSVMAQIMRRTILDMGDRMLERQPNTGTTELREAISDYLLRGRGMRAEPERIIIGAGSEYLYGLAAQLFSPGTRIALENPSYDKIRLVYETHGIICDMLPMDPEGISPRALNATQAKIIHVTPFSSYPSGVTAPAGRRYEYIKWAAKRDGYIIEDDFNSEFYLQRRPIETLYSMDEGERVIYINTFSKSLAPSMRLGYMVLPEKLMKEFREKLGFYSCTVSAFDQLVVARFISGGYFERHLGRTRRLMRAAAADSEEPAKSEK